MKEIGDLWGIKKNVRRDVGGESLGSRVRVGKNVGVEDVWVMVGDGWRGMREDYGGVMKRRVKEGMKKVKEGVGE